MPAVLRRINRIFRRNSRDRSRDRDSNNNNQNANNSQVQVNSNNNRSNVNNNNIRNVNRNDNSENLNVIKLRSTGYQRQSDGSVTLSVTLDKDQVECCVCLSSMTSKIYRCRGHTTSGPNKKLVCHNICCTCQWQMRRMKSGNGHTKEMQCPICKVKGNFVRNRALERQLLELSKECMHKKHGCSHRFFPWDDNRQLHEKHLCIYQSVDCPFCNQTIVGGRVNFIEHLVKSTKSIHPNIEENNQENQENIMEESQSQSMIDDSEMLINDSNEEEIEDESNSDNERDAESDNDPDFDPNSDDAELEEDMDSINEEDEDEELDDEDSINEEDESFEEEEKQAPNDIEVSDYDISSIDGDNKSKLEQEVSPCLIKWFENKSSADPTQNERNIIQRSRNEFTVNYNLGIIICFVAPTKDCECWKVYTFSISPRHNIGGNSRVYIQYYNDDMMSKFIEKEQSLGLITQSLCRPITNTLITTLSRLHPSSMRKLFNSYPAQNPYIEESTNNKIKTESFELSDEIKDNDSDMKDNSTKNSQTQQKDKNGNFVFSEEEIDDLEEYKPDEFLGTSPCTDIQCGFIFGGNNKYGGAASLITNLGIRVFTLEQSFKVGSVIDARDFTGKWYQAEVISVKDCEGNEYINLDCDSDDYLEIRRAKIHYLGYSQNYDEWLNVDTDSHRIAQRGTFTVGPDLRAVRKNTTHLHNQSNGNNGNNNAPSNGNVLHRGSIRSHRNSNRRTGNNQPNNIEIDQED